MQIFMEIIKLPQKVKKNVAHTNHLFFQSFLSDVSLSERQHMSADAHVKSLGKNTNVLYYSLQTYLVWEKVHLRNCSILIMQPHKLNTWGSIAKRQLSETNHHAKYHHVRRIWISENNRKLLNRLKRDVRNNTVVYKIKI